MAKVSSSRSSGGSSARKSTPSRPPSRASSRAGKPKPTQAAKPSAAARPKVKDTVQVSPEAKTPATQWPDPKANVPQLEQAYGKTPDVPFRYGWDGKATPKAEEGMLLGAGRRMEEVGKAAQQRADQFKQEWKASPGTALYNAADDAGTALADTGRFTTDLGKHYSKAGADWVDNKLTDTPGSSVTRPLVKAAHGAVDGVLGLPEDVTQMVGRPVESAKNLWEVAKDPVHKIGQAWDKRVRENGKAHALGETATDVLGFGKGLLKLGSLGKASDAARVGKETVVLGNTIEENQ